MSEKRKPRYTMLLKKQGNAKSGKIEIFAAGDFDESLKWKRKFRVRVNGKWWPKGERVYLTLTEIKEIIFRQIQRQI